MTQNQEKTEKILRKYLKEEEEIIWSTSVESAYVDYENASMHFAIALLIVLGSWLVSFDLMLVLLVLFLVLILFNQKKTTSTAFWRAWFRPTKSTSTQLIALTNQGYFQIGAVPYRRKYSDFKHYWVKDSKFQPPRLVLSDSASRLNISSNDVIIQGEYDASELSDLITPYWKKRFNKNKETKIYYKDTVKALTTKICELYDLQQKSILRSTTLTGKYKSFEIKARYDNKLPVHFVSIYVTFTNPTNSYFRFSREDIETSLRKLLRHKEHKVGDAIFDETFFLNIDNSELATDLFANRNLRGRMMTCLRYAQTSWSFGEPSPKNQKVKIAMSRLNDQDDVLDFQLLDQENALSLPDEHLEWEEGKIGTLTMKAAVHQEYCNSKNTLERILHSGFLSSLELAEKVEAYHEKVQSK